VRRSREGFDFRPLLTRLSRDLLPVDTACSPFRRLPWWLNSQVFARIAVPG
jgi:hypothetical protein